jgi:hypothetical protein
MKHRKNEPTVFKGRNGATRWKDVYELHSDIACMKNQIDQKSKGPNLNLEEGDAWRMIGKASNARKK